MSRWRDFAGKGAAARLRAAKRLEAECRDDVTAWERTAAHRRHRILDEAHRRLTRPAMTDHPCP